MEAWERSWDRSIAHRPTRRLLCQSQRGGTPDAGPAFSGTASRGRCGSCTLSWKKRERREVLWIFGPGRDRGMWPFAAAIGRSSLLGLGRCVCRWCLLIKSASACSSVSFPFRLPRRRRLLRWVAADLSRLPSRCWYCSSPHPLSLHHSDEIKRPSTVRVPAPALIYPTPQLLPHHPVTLHLPVVLDWTDINLCSSTASKMKGTAPKNSDGG